MLDIQEPENELPPNKHAKVIKSFFIAIIVIFLMLAVFYVVGNQIKNDGGIKLRDATEKDINLSQSIEASIATLQDAYVLIPLYDIDDLELTFTYYDKSEKILSRVTKNLGDVWKDRTYYITIEHSLSEFFQMEKYSYRVTNGTISLF